MERELLAKTRIGRDQRTTDHVGMAADVLGCGVHDDVGSQRQRLLEIRRGERVVDDQLGA